MLDDRTMKLPRFALIPAVLGVGLSVIAPAVPARAQSGTQPCSQKELRDLRERYALVESELVALRQQESSLNATREVFAEQSDGPAAVPIVLARSWTLAPPVSRQLRLVVDHLTSSIRATGEPVRVVLVDPTGRITSPLAILSISDAAELSFPLVGARLSAKQLAAVLADLSKRSALARNAVIRKSRDLSVRIDQRSRDFASLGLRLRACGRDVPCAVPPSPGFSSVAAGPQHEALPVLRLQEIPECPGPSTSAVPTVPPSVAPTTTTVGCAAAGTWVHQTTDIGSTTWTVTSGGIAQESGIGNATGQASLSGRSLTITFVASDRVTTGVYTWNLAEGCRSGSGSLQFTGPPTRAGATHTSTVTRISG